MTPGGGFVAPRCHGLAVGSELAAADETKDECDPCALNVAKVRLEVGAAARDCRKEDLGTRVELADER